MPAALATLGPVPAATGPSRTGLIAIAAGGALGSSGTYLLTLAWPQAWGGPLRSALVAGVIGCLLAGIAVGMRGSSRSASPRAILRGALLGIAAGSTGLGLLVTPAVMETTAWRGVTYLAVTAVATVAVFMIGTYIGARATGARPFTHGSGAQSPFHDHRRRRRTSTRRPPVVWPDRTDPDADSTPLRPLTGHPRTGTP